MNVVFKLMAFSIMLNFAIGIMLTAIVDKDGNNVFDLGDTAGLIYDSNYTGEFDGLKEDLKPSGVVEDTQSAIDRLLDTINLGFFKKMLSTVDKYMFGIVNIFKGMFDSGLRSDNPDLANLFFGNPNGLNIGMFKSIMTFAYIFGAFYLWTGRNIDGN